MSKQSGKLVGFLKLYIAVLPLFFPLYIFRFTALGIPFSLLEILICLGFLFYTLLFIFKKIEYQYISKKIWITSLLLVVFVLLSCWDVPQKIIFENNIFYPLKTSLGIWKSWFLSPLIYLFLISQLITDGYFQGIARKSKLFGTLFSSSVFYGSYGSFLYTQIWPTRSHHFFN